ncbi:Ppx/GppA phosphatase family protein [Hyphococcus aureus]|uniref:Ppx/GppA phosphatase family protein n=2 Tax=Hyphococcus aureus TaxID=2666033 RepID=A0ABW1L192_9PROT
MSDSKRGGRAGGENRKDRKTRPPTKSTEKKASSQGRRRRPLRLAALDLGTNNCRLLIASPHRSGFRIVDAFSRIVRLGEGLSQSGVLSEEAMERTIGALKVCADKVNRRSVSHMRCIATQACRGAANGPEFLDAVARETGLKFDIITTEEEARLAVAGCADLLDQDAEAGLVFDIGGGSTELSWVRRKNGGAEIAAWTSLPFGVVSIAEKWGGHEMSEETYAAVVADVRKSVAQIGDPAGMKEIFARDAAHLLGTSGTVTSIAGVHLGLARYRRDRVDGLWLSIRDAKTVTSKLCAMNFSERAREPCIGEERADLVVSGCAILEALQAEWPATRIRVADRGLREGVLADLALQAKSSRRNWVRGEDLNL